MNGSALAFSILHQYIAPETKTYSLYLPHVVLVTNFALEIARRQGLAHDSLLFIEEAGLLHDIGIIQVKDPELGCFGDAEYIQHGVLGAQMLRSHGLEKHALVAERHTGVGITAKEIQAQKLPLPERDYLPLSQEEVILCYADLFYSKDPQKLWEKKTPEQVASSLARFGQEKVVTFLKWSEKYGF